MFIGIGLGLNMLRQGASTAAMLAALAGADPYMSLDFVRGEYVKSGQLYPLASVPGYSFTRASGGYGENSAGQQIWFNGSVTNLLTYSQEFDNAAWVKAASGVVSAPVVTANYGTAPDGTQTADRIQFAMNGGTATTDISSITSATMTGVSGSVYVSTFYVKSNTASSYAMQIRDIAGAGVAITVTPAWQRVTAVATAGGTSLNLGLRLRGGQSPTNSDSADILVWGGQCELVQNPANPQPTTYIPTTSSTASLPSQPRITDKGILIEGARTNLCLRSQEFDNASWTTANGTLTANQTAAPDGTVTADKLVGTSTSSQGRVSQAITGTIGATYAVSVFAKSAGGTLVRVYVDDNSTNTASVTYNSITGAVSSAAAIGGGNWTAVSSLAQSLGNGWWRFTLIFTATTVAPARFQVWHRDTSDGTNGIFIWGYQVEAAAFPSSYIPTTSASQTRAADILTFSSISGAYPWSLYAEFERVVDTGGVESLLAFDDGTTNERAMLYVSAADRFAAQARASSASVYDAVAGPNPIALGTRYKGAARFQTDNFINACAGSLGTADVSGAAPSGTNIIRIGATTAGATPLFGYIRTAALFPAALADARLQALAA